MRSLSTIFPSGFRVSNLVLRSTDLKGKLKGPVDLLHFECKSMSWQWPGWSTPARIHVSGLSCRVQQRNMPEVRDLKLYSLQLLETKIWTSLMKLHALHGPQMVGNIAPWNEKEKSKLKILESLLWTGPQGTSKTSTMLHWILHRASHLLIVLCFHKLVVEVDATSVLYIQEGEPGPGQGAAVSPRRDGLLVEMRSLHLRFVQSPLEDQSALSAHSEVKMPGPDAKEGGLHTGMPTPTVLAPDAHASSTGKRQFLYRLVCFFARRPRLSSRSEASEIKVATAELLEPKKGQKAAYQLAIAGVAVTMKSKHPGSEEHRTVSSSAAGRERPDAASRSGHAVRVSGPRGGPATRSVHRKRPHVAAGSGQPGLTAGGQSFTSSPSLPYETAVPEASELEEWDVSYSLLQHWGMEVEISSQILRGAVLKPHQVPEGRQEVTSGKRTPSGPKSPALYFSLSSGIKSRSPSAPPVTPQGENAAHPAAGAVRPSAPSLKIKITVTLKALVPELNPNSTLQALRMVDHFLTFNEFAHLWARRPKGTISQSPVAWWQHAGNSIINTCRCERETSKSHLILYTSAYLSRLDLRPDVFPPWHCND